MSTATSLYTTDLFSEALHLELAKTIREFEEAKNQKVVEKEGIFYTPIKLAAKMALDCLGPHLEQAYYPELLKIKILDPSCGSGVFLLVCYEMLIARLKDIGQDNPNNRREVLSNCIFGVDKDLTAILMAEKLLNHVCGAETKLLQTNLINANSLFDLGDFDSSNLSDKALLQEFPIVSWSKTFPEKFTLIIGNPPYGISRNEKLSVLENAKLKLVFASYKMGKVNKYLAFMARGYELLKDGGTMSYVVPNAWLGIEAGRELRAKLTESGSFESVEHFAESPFSALEVETIVFRYKKLTAIPEIKLTTYKDADNFETLSTGTFRKDLCNRGNEFIIPVNWTENLETLRTHLAHNCLELASESFNFAPFIALQAYSTGKGVPPQSKETVKSHAFHSITAESKNHIPYLEGSDVKRYSINWSGKYLKYGKHLAEPQKLDRFKGVRILLREILNPYPYVLIACLTKQTFLYNKSILHIIPRCPEGDDADFFALLCILNSSFAGYVIRSFGRKSQRKLFPKIVNADLKNFPLPKDFQQQKTILSDFGRIATTKDFISADFQEEVDRQVLKAYQLENLKLTA